MKKFEYPELEIEEIELKDIIATSGEECTDDCPDFIPCDSELPLD